MSGAADTLGQLARKAKQESVRLAAARAVLELGAQLRETVELEQRIAALEGTNMRRTASSEPAWSASTGLSARCRTPDRLRSQPGYR